MHLVSSKNFLAAIVFVVACSPSEEKTSEIFQEDGAAIGGYDAVAFFTEAKPVKGMAGYSARWKDATWYFSSQANRDSFQREPSRYAPQYGGFCAFGTAEGHKAPTRADTWTIREGKLYFNYNQEVKQLWDKNRAQYIIRADTNWEKIKHSTY